MALLVAGAFFMEILDATIITPAIPLIARSFGAEAVDVNIAISAYLVTVAVLIPATGWMADRFGIRRVFLTAIVIFTVASVGCAASASLPMLVAMRVLQGVGGAMMVPVGRLAVLRYSDKSDLVRAIALLTWPALAAPIIAVALGGAIVTVGSWRWIFLLNIPLGIIGFMLALKLIHGPPSAVSRTLDWRGLLLMGLGISAALLALEHVRLRGVDVPTLVVVALAGALIVGAVVHLLRAPSDQAVVLHGEPEEPMHRGGGAGAQRRRFLSGDVSAPRRGDGGDARRNAAVARGRRRARQRRRAPLRRTRVSRDCRTRRTSTRACRDG